MRAGMGVVVITDHHLPPAVLPGRGGRRPASARLRLSRPGPHRRRPVVQARGGAWSGGLGADGLAAIAAIGTVADLAPMTGESRAIVRLGLEELARTSHAGRALLARGCDVPAHPTARDLAFGVVPHQPLAGSPTPSSRSS